MTTGKALAAVAVLGLILTPVAAASQHASVLRGAGLIASHRQGSAVLHVLTPLGAELLQAG